MNWKKLAQYNHICHSGCIADNYLEFTFSHHAKHKNYEYKETLGSVFIGIGNLAVNLMMKVVLLYGAVGLYNIIPWRMELNWWTLIPCYIAYDFCNYWSHRTSYYNRFLGQLMWYIILQSIITLLFPFGKAGFSILSLLFLFQLSC